MIFFYKKKIKGALFGGISGLAVMSWICLSAQVSIANGNINFPQKPLTTEGCDYNFTMKPLPKLNATSEEYVQFQNDVKHA